MITIGDVVPLSVQIHDLNPDLILTAKIFQPNNELIASVLLRHVSNGLYTSDLFEMPEYEYIRVQYLPNNLDDYSVGMELFYSSPKEVNEKLYIGELIEVSKDKDIIEGKMYA